MKKRVLLGAVVFILAIAVSLAGLMSSEAGSRWLLQTVFSSLPARVSVKTIEGRLLDRLVISDFSYMSGVESVAIKKFVFAWTPSKLFTGTLKIVDMSLDGLNISVNETAPQPEETGFDFDAELLMPVNIVIDKLQITDFTFQQGGSQQQVDKLSLSAFTEKGRLVIASLDVHAKSLTLAAKGEMTLGNGFPFKLTADWQAATDNYGLWRATAVADGDFRQLNFDNRLTSPFTSILHGRLENLQDEPRMKIRADWQKLHWPLVKAPPEMTSEQGYIELAGLLNDYRITLNADLTQPYLPEGHLAFEGKGGEKSLSIDKLELKSTAGLFQLGGDVLWNDAVIFDLTATGQRFNPAVLVKEIPGSLTFNTRLKGKMAGASLLQLEADIKKLSGRLRGNPVSANGKLVWTGETLKADALQVVSGKNNIALNGALGPEKADFNVSIAAPDLEALWPDLGGSLKGEGQVLGALKNPDVTFQAKGSRLRVAGNSAEQVTLDIGYHADVRKTSRMQLSANGIKTGASQLSKLLIEGSGTLDTHRFTADIRSSEGDVSSVLNGRLGDREWQGDFSALDLKSPDFGRWRLKDNASVRVAKKADGWHAVLAETCLIRQDAALCGQGSFLASGDFKFSVKAAALPISLAQVYLPEQMKVNGIINADAALERQKGVLAGNFELAVPANAKVQLQAQQGSTTLALGASSLKGRLEGTLVSADYDVALAENDYLRGALQFDTGVSESLSGRLKASVTDFALLKPFVPQVSDITGRLKADLEWRGTQTAPVITGTAALEQGAVEMDEIGFALRGINLQAAALGGRRSRIQLQGAASPAMLPRKGAAEQVQLNGQINLNADLEQQEGVIAGTYRIDVPADASIVFKTEDASTKIPVGASSLSGSVNDKIITADLDLSMAARDYLRAKLRLDAGATRALSGEVKASVAEFALLNPFVPELSNIKGNLKADLALAGSIDNPDINGTVDLTQGSADLNRLGLGFRAVELHALASPDRAEPIVLNGSAKSGQGDIKLEGYANLQGSAELTLNGKNFEVARLSEAQIAVSPELKLAYAGKQGKVTGNLMIPKAVLQLPQLPENAVKVSKDEVILGEEKTRKNAAPATDIDADIVVELGKQVKFSGQGLETGLSGKLKVTKTGEKMAMFGIVDMDKAKYKSYGQDLTVRRGRFIFNGPVDKPWLDVEAIRVSKSEKVTAILSLSGPLDAPKTHISSEPALPETDALAYLITGRPLNQVSKAEGNMLAGAALAYGANQASWIADKLGVDEFEVKEGQTLQDTLVSVGQYLTPDFYVGSKVGLFNKQAVIVLKHKLTETINVETQTGTSQRIKLNYEFDTD